MTGVAALRVQKSIEIFLGIARWKVSPECQGSKGSMWRNTKKGADGKS